MLIVDHWIRDEYGMFWNIIQRTRRDSWPWLLQFLWYFPTEHIHLQVIFLYFPWFFHWKKHIYRWYLYIFRCFAMISLYFPRFFHDVSTFSGDIPVFSHVFPMQTSTSRDFPAINGWEKTVTCGASFSELLSEDTATWGRTLRSLECHRKTWTYYNYS